MVIQVCYQWCYYRGGVLAQRRFLRFGMGVYVVEVYRPEVGMGD